MRETLLTKSTPCFECEEEIIEGSYAWTDEFEEKILCNSCKEHKEEYFGGGYTAKMD